jgi:hypothetical protein
VKQEPSTAESSHEKLHGPKKRAQRINFRVEFKVVVVVACGVREGYWEGFGRAWEGIWRGLDIGNRVLVLGRNLDPVKGISERCCL